MRIEEGVFGQPNKIKTELIDFIRGGGNASTPVDGLCVMPYQCRITFIGQTEKYSRAEFISAIHLNRCFNETPQQAF